MLEGKQAVLFDLIDTLVHYDGPLSTGHDKLASLAFRSAFGERNSAELNQFLTVWQDLRTAKYREAQATLREIDLVGRVRETLGRMGPAYAVEGNISRFLLPYLNGYVDQLSLPTTHPAILGRLRERFRLAVVSNWQYPLRCTTSWPGLG